MQNPFTVELRAALHPGFKRSVGGAILVLLAVIAFGWVVRTNTRTLVADTRSLERTWQAINEIDGTVSTLTDSETGQRGYLLTGDLSYLEPYRNSVTEVRVHLSRLHALIANNPAQRARLQDLEELVGAKMVELADTIRLFAAGDQAAALRTVHAGFGRQMMDRIRATARAMRADETKLQAERFRRTEQAAAGVMSASVLGGACFLALVAVFFAFVRIDLLGRARAEAEARQSEERLSTTLRSIGDAVLTTDERGLVDFLNPIAERLTGWAAGEAVGRPVEDVLRVVDERTRTPVESAAKNVLRGGLVTGIADHALLIARDGSEIPIADSAAPIHDATGGLAGVVLVFRDTTEQRRADTANRRLATIVASANFAMAAETVDNVITDWNPGAEALFGFTAAEMIGRRMYSLAPPQSPPDPSPALTAELLAGRSVAEFEARRLTKDGRLLDIVTTLSPIRDESGRVTGISRLLRDVTDRRRQSRELDEARLRAEEASAAKDRFLATLSHELRTPLTPIVASVHRLERRADLQPGMAESLAMIRRNVELEARLIDDLLDLTRIASGKVELERLPINLHAVLSNVAQNARSEFFKKGVALVPDLAAEDHHCIGDEARLQQVFWNLIRNAVKFTPPGGRVTLRSENLEAGRIRIVVTDTGRGIRADSLPRIFDAFDQGDVTAVRRAEGLGLGLAIARNLVELHEGSISATSDGEDRGSSFSVELGTTPLRPAPISAGASPPDRVAARHRASLLLVEDDVDTAEGLELLLREAGFRVRVADSVEAAIELFREKSSDVLLTDVGLPDGSGLDLLGRLRAMQPQLQAIVLSGYGMEDDIRRTRDLGFAEHLVKPLNLNRLIAVLDSLIASTRDSAPGRA